MQRLYSFHKRRRCRQVPLGLGPDDVDLLVVSDAEEILGIGDWGVNGTDISVGKLAVYTAAAGIHPDRVIAVNLDVGTDNEQLLNDPAYLGNRHARVRGERYERLIDTYLQVASEMLSAFLLPKTATTLPPATPTPTQPPTCPCSKPSATP